MSKVSDSSNLSNHARRYEFVAGDSIEANGKTATRIRALVDMPQHGVKAGYLGGCIQSEKNLPQDSNSWVAPGCSVWDDAVVLDNARISGNVVLEDAACVRGIAKVHGDYLIGGHTLIE